MKPDKPSPETVAKPSRDRFVKLGTAVMRVSREELEKREKAWTARQARKKR
jgi:hypothetical protein